MLKKQQQLNEYNAILDERCNDLQEQLKTQQKLLDYCPEAIEIIDAEYTETESPKQLTPPPSQNVPLFSLNKKPKEGWEIVEGGLTDRSRKESQEPEK